MAKARAGDRTAQLAVLGAAGALPLLRGAHELTSDGMLQGCSKGHVALVAPTQRTAPTLDGRRQPAPRTAFPSTAHPVSIIHGPMHASLLVDPRWEPGAGNPLAGILSGGRPARAVPTGTAATFHAWKDPGLRPGGGTKNLEGCFALGTRQPALPPPRCAWPRPRDPWSTRTI